MKEALFYKTEKENRVLCQLCNHRCHIKDGKRGLCGVRVNQKGKLFSLVFGRLVSANADPIEKKPLFHFLPGSRSYSISTVGCNFHCLHCQNYQISQYPHFHNGEIVGTKRNPQSIIDEAQQTDCASISYTYVEPTVFYEFAYECSQLAHKAGIKNIFVSNGYMTPEVTRHLAQFLDGINIDVKAFTETFYKKVCKARLQPVLDTVQLMHDLGVWVEVTTLIIPGYNDSEKELRDIASFIHGVDPAIPWHVTAFYPTFQLTGPERTPEMTLRRARDIGFDEGLRYVYEGNIPGEGGENTYCPGCGNELIRRFGFSILESTILNGRCKACNEKIEGVWSLGE